jgi:Beta-lactamase class C and other penicillin binding proteins
VVRPAVTRECSVSVHSVDSTGLKGWIGCRIAPGRRAQVALIGKMVEQIANETHKNVDSVLLIKKGKLVLEEYFYQYDRDKLHQLRSATKSVVSALVGIALDKKLITSKEEKWFRSFRSMRSRIFRRKSGP